MLAARLLLGQGLAVTGITFVTPFFGSARGEASARQLGIPLEVVDITDEHLAMVKDPPHGYGRNMNPCIDCHAMMFAVAGKMLDEAGGGVLFSGEVLGQRPMSQNIKALEIVARQSGYVGRILRPLSARLLPETSPEAEGLVSREALLDIQGRSRKRQMELARNYGLEEFPSPGGGCLLTDPGFSVRLRELLEKRPLAGETEVNLLKYGRHFRLADGHKLVVGRHLEDNEAMEQLAREGDTIIKADAFPGPLSILESGATDREVEQAASITVRYGKAAGEKEAVVSASTMGGDSCHLTARAMAAEELEKWRIG
jgi:tRNA U34 2-thiouridine synthase MnmA/TrmU